MTTKKGAWLDAWHVNPSANRDYDLIDGIRGIAILLVLFNHSIYINPKETHSVILWISAMSSVGGQGVNIFFVLSGFLISWPFWKRKVKGAHRIVPPGYGWRRFFKIYPPLALSVLFFTPIYVAYFHEPSLVLTAFQWFSGLSLIIPPDGKLNPVMWSLLVETQFYIFLPILFLVLKRMPIKTCLYVVFLFLFSVGQLSHWIFYQHGWPNTFYPTVNYHFPTLLDAFSFGVLLAGLESYWNGLPKSWGRLGDAGAVLLITTLLGEATLNFLHIDHGYFQGCLLDLLVRISSVLLLCYIAQPENPRARLLCMPWLRWFGIISYEWYLFHQPLLIWSRSLIGSAEANFVRYAMIVGAPILIGLVISALVYRYFSLPILKFGRDKHTNRPDSTSNQVIA